MTSEIALLKKQIDAYNDRLFELRSVEDRAAIVTQRNRVLRKVHYLAKAQLANSTKSGKVSLEFAERALPHGLIFLT